MTLQELQKQALQLSISERWQLMQTLMESLQQETRPVQKGNLSRLRGIAKGSDVSDNKNTEGDYTTYLTQKYQ
ncbi:hypothetical protein WA1_20425 [Scytonema hofmannii PCC 7110]|uniref:Uncharacterized protein n=1 Tax=Scytonema hofmannii PCC 7110 TaxID=128403 RepID=A0A139XCB7_9CYAN|nr:hypothetical protein [Scytonema hofmannii]KYC42339.1 hypothetical protein WA1_20425 [Scytonema hofmannii PCC 7110]